MPVKQLLKSYNSQVVVTEDKIAQHWSGAGVVAEYPIGAMPQWMFDFLESALAADAILVTELQGEINVAP